MTAFSVIDSTRAFGSSASVEHPKVKIESKAVNKINNFFIPRLYYCFACLKTYKRSLPLSKLAVIEPVEMRKLMALFENVIYNSRNLITGENYD